MSEPRRDRTMRSLPTARIRHGRLRRSSGWRTALSGIAAGLSIVLVSGASVAAITVAQLDANIDEVVLTGANGEVREVPTVGEWEGGFNIMLVGVDNAAGQMDEAERDGATLNDVNLLVHVAEDQQSAVVVSIPRDLVVPIPECPQEDGGTSWAMSAQPFNSTYSVGGLNCVVLTAEALTGLSIPYAATISFDGVAMMSSAVGGVEVCIDAPIVDKLADLNLPTAGKHIVEGYTALGFLRTRKGVGDGSDLSRISNQQVYMSSLLRTLQGNGTLTDPGKLYNLAQVATKAMSLSSSLASLDTMVSMALVLKDIPTDRITFVQYPARTGLEGVFANKAAPVESLAEELFEKIRNDEPFLLEADATGNGSSLDPNAAPATPAPTASPSASASPEVPAVPGTEAEPAEVLTGVLGQTAAQQTCSVAN